MSEEDDKCWECDMPAVVKYHSPWSEDGEPHCARCAEEGGYNEWLIDPSSSVAGRDAGYWTVIVK